jgi:hypothetical protein
MIFILPFLSAKEIIRNFQEYTKLLNINNECWNAIIYLKLE